MNELETLKQQVVDMQETIARMEQETVQVKQWEPQGGEWYVDFNGSIYTCNSSPLSKAFGSEYQTKEQAEWASRQMRQFNRLLCYVVEHTNNLYDINIDTCPEDSSGIIIGIDVPSILRANLRAKIQSGEVVL